MHHHAVKPQNKGASFYDVDGTLIKTNIVHAFAWYAKHQPTVDANDSDQRDVIAASSLTSWAGCKARGTAATSARTA